MVGGELAGATGGRLAGATGGELAGGTAGAGRLGRKKNAGYKNC